MHFDPKYTEITDDVHAVIIQAFRMHNESYNALARTLNFESGTTAKDLVIRKSKYINKEKLRQLEEYIVKNAHNTPNAHSVHNTQLEEIARFGLNLYPSDVVRLRKIIVNRHGVITGHIADTFREMLDIYEQRDFKKLGL